VQKTEHETKKEKSPLDGLMAMPAIFHEGKPGHESADDGKIADGEI
jgi:hypothetical protein